jgi:hypothetical protein
VVVHDFDLVSAVVEPNKTDSPLIVDANAVLSFSFALQGFQVIARWHSQTDQFSDSMQLQQLAPSHALDVVEPGHHLASKQSLGVGTNERMDHGAILFRVTESVKKIKTHASDESPPHHDYETKASMSGAPAGLTSRPASCPSRKTTKVGQSFTR